jgi:PTS system nitrogen regulatory IIA component
MFMDREEFIEFFQRELFVADMNVASKEAALKRLVKQLYKRQKIKNEKILLHTLLEREKLGSTGIGDSIAIPHSRSLMVPRLTLLFARSKKGINFDSVDGKPVHLIFLIVAPPQDEGNKYLPLLGKLIELVKDKKNRNTMLNVPNFRELKKFLREKCE